MPKDRRQSAYRVRVEAADLARERTHPKHEANPDEQRYASAHYAMSFTKGLEHDTGLGVVAQPVDFENFRACIDEGFIEPFTSRVRVPQDQSKLKCSRRQWEAPTAGVVYDLEGPDAQAVTMPPAPELGSAELAYEMAEVYELALLRDVPFTKFSDGQATPELTDAIDRLNHHEYAQNGYPGRKRITDKTGQLTDQNVFRGSSPGVEKGPYLSQFLWIGSDQPGQGLISYGAQRINQRVPIATPRVDHMQIWDDWLHVQNGYDVNRCGHGKFNKECSKGQELTDDIAGDNRFIYTPRDLATYVHFDALYQAYLNATLILLGMGTPFDPGFASLSGMRDMYNPAKGSSIDRNAGGFALYGPPHILTLVTEVATRALKAVRFQKFNNHLRLRPEALAARIEKAADLDACFPSLCSAFTNFRNQVGKTVGAVEDFNNNKVQSKTALLPMAFAEGSPMHPTYGAGHATVAGACTTIVKAFFDTGAVLGHLDTTDPCAKDKFGFFHKIKDASYYLPIEKGTELEIQPTDCPLTLEGELNKLAANISIGRNMAGVHYFSDYYDSLRMGEEIAIGMLEEQALCYPTDDFVLSMPTFDGKLVRIGRK
ncbi:hypothetical protein IWQ54_006463 [Labrenzia sp. EL_195]|nr:hypothetical protein [Labrenzia sp. EL_195]